MKDKLRIAFITVVPSPYQRDLFASLAARNELELEVHYLESASPDSPWPEAPLRPYERILPGTWFHLGPARFHLNWRLPDLSRTDFVILSTYSSWTGQWLMRRRLRRRPWLFWGERIRPQPTWIRTLAQQFLIRPLAEATAIVGIGRAAKEDYARRFPSTPHFNLAYHCSLTEYQGNIPPRPHDSPFTFLFCGQMIRRKGVDLLLQAFDRLIQQGTQASLLLVGREADLPTFLATISPAARKHIRYEGFQPPERLPLYYAQADAFILPSRHDGWGVVINQALGAGLPVISSDAAGAGLDLVEENVNGLRFTAGDTTGLMSAMQKLVTDPTLACAWGQASRQKARDLTPEAGAEKWVRILTSLRNVA